jgi:hypothetical protein
MGFCQDWVPAFAVTRISRVELALFTSLAHKFGEVLARVPVSDAPMFKERGLF